MATTTYKDLASAQAAYEQILAARNNAAAQKTSALRRGETNRQLALMAVRNHLAQRGLANTGAAESAILRAQGMPVDTSAYDAQLADYEGQLTGLDRVIQQFRNAQANSIAGAGGGAANTTTNATQNAIQKGVQRSIGALNAVTRQKATGQKATGSSGYGYNQNRKYNVKQVM